MANLTNRIERLENSTEELMTSMLKFLEGSLSDSAKKGLDTQLSKIKDNFKGLRIQALHEAGVVAVSDSVSSINEADHYNAFVRLMNLHLNMGLIITGSVTLLGGNKFIIVNADSGAFQHNVTVDLDKKDFLITTAIEGGTIKHKDASVVSIHAFLEGLTAIIREDEVVPYDDQDFDYVIDKLKLTGGSIIEVTKSIKPFNFTYDEYNNSFSITVVSKGLPYNIVDWALVPYEYKNALLSAIKDIISENEDAVIEAEERKERIVLAESNHEAETNKFISKDPVYTGIEFAVKNGLFTETDEGLKLDLDTVSVTYLDEPIFPKITFTKLMGDPTPLLWQDLSKGLKKKIRKDVSLLKAQHVE